MNILVIEDIASSGYGGAERSMRSFCEYLGKQHQLVLTYEREGDYVTDPERKKLYSAIYQVSTSTIRQQGIFNWWRSLRALIGICRKHKIDVTCTHVVHCLAMLRLLKIFTGVTTTVYFKWVTTSPRVGRFTQWGLRGVDRVATVSRFVAGYWQQNGAVPKRVKVIPEGIKLGMHQPEAQDRSPIRLAFAGRITHEKGLHLVVEAVHLLRQRGVPVELHVAGFFDTKKQHNLLEYHKTIASLIDRHGLDKAIFFHGYVDPLTAFLAKQHLVVVPSICQDAQPLVILEAFATDMPVIASRVGGIPEILEGDFRDFIFESDQVESIVNAVLFTKKQYLDNPANLDNLRKQIHEYAHRKYDLPVSLTALEQHLIYGKTSHAAI